MLRFSSVKYYFTYYGKQTRWKSTFPIIMNEKALNYRGKMTQIPFLFNLSRFTLSKASQVLSVFPIQYAICCKQLCLHISDKLPNYWHSHQTVRRHKLTCYKFSLTNSIADLVLLRHLITSYSQRIWVSCDWYENVMSSWTFLLFSPVVYNCVRHMLVTHVFTRILFIDMLQYKCFAHTHIHTQEYKLLAVYKVYKIWFEMTQRRLRSVAFVLRILLLNYWQNYCRFFQHSINLKFY